MKITFPFFSRISRRLIHTHTARPGYFNSPHLVPTHRLHSRPLITMAALTAKLKLMDLEQPLPKYPGCHPDYNPTDVYRAHLTEILTKVTGVDAAILYPALQWTQTLEKGDLVLPVPALRIKGKKGPELIALAEEWVANVIPPI